MDAMVSTFSSSSFLENPRLQIPVTSIEELGIGATHSVITLHAKSLSPFSVPGVNSTKFVPCCI